MNLRFPILGLVLSLVYGHAFELTADWPILRTTPASGIQLQPAQVGDLPGEATLMQMRLAALIEEKNWEEAIAAFFKLIDRYGDLPIAIGDESNRYLSVATYGHMLLADLPPEAIALYRDRVDAAAGDWYRGLRTVTNPTSEQAGQLDQFFAVDTVMMLCSFWAIGHWSVVILIKRGSIGSGSMRHGRPKEALVSGTLTRESRQSS